MKTLLPTLSRDDCEELVAALTNCLVVFEKKTGSLSVPELQMKSVITMLRTEVTNQCRWFDFQERQADQGSTDISGQGGPGKNPGSPAKLGAAAVR